MKINSLGEAYTEKACPICKTPHRLMSDYTAERFKKLGMTDDEINKIAAQQAAMHADLERHSHAPLGEDDEEDEETPEERRRRLTRARVAAWKERQKGGGNAQ